MGAITHNGEVLQGLPGVASQVNYDNSDSGLSATQVQDAIDEVNEKIDTLGTASTKDVPVSGNASTSQVVMGNDTRLSDARPASDVSAWAKASTKPSYTASEVGAVASNDVATLQSIELTPNSGSGHGGYIDFHYNGSSADNTSRIIEAESGNITINGVSITGLSNDVNQLKSGLKFATWLPENGFNPLTQCNGFYCYSVNPNLMIYQGTPNGFSEYATIFGCSGTTYQLLIYVDVFGSSAAWSTNRSSWQQFADKSDISTLQSNFQAGVDSIYNAIAAQGTTPASKSLSDVVNGIGTMSTNRYNSGVSDADGRSNPSSYNYQTGYNAGYSAGYNAGAGAAKSVPYSISLDGDSSGSHKVDITFGNTKVVDGSRVWYADDFTKSGSITY